MSRQIRTCIRPRLHDCVSFGSINICKYLFLKTFQNWIYIYIYIKEIYIFFAHQKETLCDEKRKYIHRLFNIFFQIATFSKMDLYIYLDINFRSIVLFSDGKIADRQTNNSFNSLIQSRSFILEILIPPNSDCSRSNH